MDQQRAADGTALSPRGPEIAVVGMSGRFPGAEDVEKFWANISAGIESFVTFSDEDLISAGVEPSVFENPNYVRSRPVLNNVKEFDATFFGASPREAALSDPQQRLFTECVWEALEMAGYGAPGERGAVGVFAGTNISTYMVTRPKALAQAAGDTDTLMAGNDKDSLATTVSYRLDLRGPSVAVQTFCSTSLVAVHLACASLRRDECDIALAGGVSIRQPDRVGYMYQEGNQASPDGHVRTFDAGARGSMFGDGVAVVALKRLDRALADRDTVLAVIRGSALNNDGALKFSYHAPSIDGQKRCVTAALANAGIDPGDISYVEAHGTATEVGDPMEVAALTGAFNATRTTEEQQYCLLGSVKPNVGHLDRASGATGLIKVVQSLRHELIPGTRNFVTPNPEIDFEHSPFRVTSEPTPWPRRTGRPRIAGVTSLGTGGTNVHAIVTEAPEPPARAPRPRRWQVLPVSTRWEEGADRACAALAERLQADPGLDLGDVAYTLQVGRKVFNHRRVVVADTTGGAAQVLADPAAPLRRTDPTVGRRVGFLIAGVGEQYPGMVAALYADEPEFRADVDHCLELLGLADVAELSDIFLPAAAEDVSAPSRMLGRDDPQTTSAVDAHLVQPAVFVAEYALARQLIRWGLAPDVMVGYSLGEYVAACLSGVLTLEDALRLVAHRAGLIAALPPGAMLAVAADEKKLREILGAVFDELDIAVRTGSQIVVAGPVHAVSAAAETLAAAFVSCRRLSTTHAFHSRMLAPAASALTEWIRDNVTLNAPEIPYVSNVTGHIASKDLVTDPGYWARHMCETVEFGAGIEQVLASGDFAFTEIGPGQSLGALTRCHPACDRARWPLIVPTMPAASEDRGAPRALAEAVARLWLAGVSIDWASLHAQWQPGRVPLPTYPFDRREYWVEADAPSSAASEPDVDEDDPIALFSSLPRLPESEWINVPVWRQTTAPAPGADAAHWLVFTDRGLADEFAVALGPELTAAGATVTFARPGDRFADEADGFVVRPGSSADAVGVLRKLSERATPPDRVLHLWNLDVHPSADAVQRGLHTLIAFAQAAGELDLEGWSLDVVTSGSHHIVPGDTVWPERATALGPCRLIPVEYPGVRTRLIDLDEASVLRSPRALLAELRAEPRDQVVGLRGGRRWLPGYDVLDSASITSPAAQFRRGGTYLVTGGLGGIGLAMAERIASDYGARLVLFGRTPVPAPEHWGPILADPGTIPEVRRRLCGLQRITAAGASVITVAGDVSVVDDVQRAVDTALAHFGELNGIVHCAGVPAVGLMQFKTAADVAGVLAPKMAGSLAIAEAVRGIPLEFVALFSSTTSATGGGAGQVDYCAANVFLDAFAQSDPLPGCQVTAIDWGEWEWNGWTTGLEQYDSGSQEFFQQYRSTFGVSFDQGWQALQRVLATGEAHVVISTQDFPTLVAASRRSSIASHQATVRKVRDALGRHPRPELSSAYVEPQTEVEEVIAGVWSEALGLDQVGIHDNFFELGGNSLVGMEIITRVRKALGIAYLPPHLLYQAPTVATLAEAVAAEQDDGEAEIDLDARDQQQSRMDQRRSMLRTRRSA